MATMVDVDMDCHRLSALPEEILRYLLTGYCDYRDLENLWHAVSSSNQQQAGFFWDILNRVIEMRLENSTTRRSDLPEIAESLLLGLKSKERSVALRQRLNILMYSEQLSGVLWCGCMEFKDPLMPDWSARTVKVVLRCDEDNWSWYHAVGWNHSFSQHTIKLASQLYNFVPVRPRGQIFGVNPEDQAVIQDVSRQLLSRDQVMTLRFGCANGFILRIISPAQAHQRLARFGRAARSPGISTFETSAEALVCSWECPPISEDNCGVVHDISKQLEAINAMVQEMEGTTS